MLTEPQFEHMLARLQLVAERAPVHLRPKRRQIVRGMRAALIAVVDDLSPEAMRDALVFELTGIVREEPVVVRMGTPDPIPEHAERIIEHLNQGMSINKICQAMHCGRSTVYRCRELRDERAKQRALTAQLEVENEH